MNHTQLLIAENVSIIACIAAIAIGGMVFIGSYHGLWSMVLMLFYNTKITKTKANQEVESA